MSPLRKVKSASHSLVASVTIVGTNTRPRNQETLDSESYVTLRKSHDSPGASVHFSLK